MVQKNERIQLAIKIVKYRALARQAPDVQTAQRINGLIAELEQKLREIDGRLGWPPEQREQRYARREKSAYLSRMPACNEVVASTRRQTTPHLPMLRLRPA